jgi:hypothetical protein
MQEELERAVLRLMLNDAPVLFEQFNSAIAIKRLFTGVGFYTYFRVEAGGTATADAHISSVGAVLNNKILVGFTLFVREGRMDFLEGYTYDSAWPDKIECYEVFALT